MPRTREDQDSAYRDAAAAFAGAIARLASAYEANAGRRADLVQDIHVALWKSFAIFSGQCSVRTWVYRVAHNAATAYVLRERRARVGRWIGLEHAERLSDESDLEQAIGQAQARQRLLALIQRLDLPDRQVVHLYLEGLDAATIGEVTRLSAGSINTRIHRFKALLGRNFNEGGAS